MTFRGFTRGMKWPRDKRPEEADGIKALAAQWLDSARGVIYFPLFTSYDGGTITCSDGHSSMALALHAKKAVARGLKWSASHSWL